MENVVNLKIIEQFKCGDVVMLISGGPLMTVRFIGKNAASVRVDWFAEGEHLYADFLPDQLVYFEEVIEEEDE